MCFNHLYDETLREQAAVTTLVQLSQDVREQSSGHDIRLWAVTGPETFEQKTSAKQAKAAFSDFRIKNLEDK